MSGHGRGSDYTPNRDPGRKDGQLGAGLFGLRPFLKRGPFIEEIDAKAALDREELREVEYEEMGLPLPQAPDEPPRRRWLADLFRRR